MVVVKLQRFRGDLGRGVYESAATICERERGNTRTCIIGARVRLRTTAKSVSVERERELDTHDGCGSYATLCFVW